MILHHDLGPGERWYVSNVSIIFYCSMLLYYLFWMFMGRTNLLTGGLAQIVVFLPISVFWRKRISNGIQREWNLRERYFWNRCDPGDLELKSRKLWGGHEGGGAPSPYWVRHCLVGHSSVPRLTSFTYISPYTLKLPEQKIDREFRRGKPL